MVHISIIAVRFYLVIFWLFIQVFNIIANYFYFTFDNNHYYLTELFDTAFEDNIPTLYSALLFFACGALTATTAYLHQLKKMKYTQQLWWLSAIFVFLAFDEGCQIHENIGSVFEDIFLDQITFTGPLYWGWVIPYGALVILIVILYVPVLESFPKKIKLGFFLSGFLFIIGALGFEMVGAAIYEHFDNSISYSIIYSIEEALEMAGTSLYIYMTLTYIIILEKPFRIVFNYDHYD